MSEAKCLNCLLTERLHVKDNITNGDVIKALFPNSRVDISCARAFFYIREDLKMFVTFDINWWNAKYKAENED